MRQTGLLSSVVRCLANCRVVALLQLRLLRHTPAGKAVVELAAHCHRLLQVRRLYKLNRIRHLITTSYLGFG